MVSQWLQTVVTYFIWLSNDCLLFFPSGDMVEATVDMVLDMEELGKNVFGRFSLQKAFLNEHVIFIYISVALKVWLVQFFASIGKALFSGPFRRPRVEFFPQRFFLRALFARVPQSKIKVTQRIQVKGFCPQARMWLRKCMCPDILSRRT